MIGVNYDLFWTLNPKSLSPFTKAFSLKQKLDDSMAWQQGVYIQMAIASCLDGKKHKYPKSPLLSEQKKVEMSSEEIKEKMLMRMEQLNSRFKKG